MTHLSVEKEALRSGLFCSAGVVLGLEFVLAETHQQGPRGVSGFGVEGLGLMSLGCKAGFRI